MLLGIEGLAFAGIQCHHGARHGRKDAGVAQFGFITAQTGLGLTDLRRKHVGPCLGGADFSLCRLNIFFAGGAAFCKVLLALQLLFCQIVQGALFLQLSLEVFDGKAAGIEFGGLGGRVDFDQKLAFLDFSADVDVDLVDLP